MSCPLIAGWIRCLRFDAVTTFEYEDEALCRISKLLREDHHHRTYDAEIQNFRHAIARLEKIFRLSDISNHGTSKLNIAAALLVSSAFNLTELSIPVNQNTLALLSLLGQNNTIGGASCLSKIESLHLFCSAEKSRQAEVSFDSITPFLLLLPKLDRIWITGCSGHNYKKVHNDNSTASLHNRPSYSASPPLLLAA